MYSSREAKILSICLLRDDYITYQEISDQLNISTRTIMRELSQLKNSLQKMNLKILSKKGKGILISGTEEAKQNLIMDIQGSKIDYMDKEERQELLCLELLHANEIQKLYYYSNKFQVSEATISHDLDDLEKFFAKYDIKMIRRPGYGVGLEADESEIRRAISTIINNTVQHHIMNVDFDRYNIQDVINQISVTKNSNMNKLLDYDVLKIILEVFKTHHEELNLDNMAKSSYMGLLIHLMIAINRIKQGEALQDNRAIFNLINDRKAYQNAQIMVDYLAKAFDITIEDTECAFVAIHLQSAKSAIIKDDENQVEQYHDLIMAMLNVFNEYQINLYSDYELYQSLAAHLEPAMVRLEYNLPIYNPMLEQIKESYQEIFEITQKACKVFEETYNYTLNEDEIGYLVLHFAAAIERNKLNQVERPINVGIVCSSGIGISALLVARLKRIVDKNVNLVPLSISEINNNNCELLISTFAIKEAIIVSPILNQNDVANVIGAIKNKRQQKPITTNKQYPSINLIEILDNIKHLIDNLTITSIPNNANKENVILTLCQQVSNDPILVTQIKERESKGSNIYNSFGFALLHTTTDLINQCIIKILKPDQKTFVNKELDNIRVVLLMLLPSKATQIQKRLMSHVSAMLIEDDNFLDNLAKSNQENLADIFNDVLQKFIINVIKEEE